MTASIHRSFNYSTYERMKNQKKV